jgi:hypothetical protein
MTLTASASNSSFLALRFDLFPPTAPSQARAYMPNVCADD